MSVISNDRQAGTHGDAWRWEDSLGRAGAPLQDSVNSTEREPEPAGPACRQGSFMARHSEIRRLCSVYI